jgi:hypothetical protein
MRIVTPARVVASLLLVPVLATSLFASDWRVPADFATIQEAVDSPDVAAGDRVLVGPGTFAGAVISKPVRIQGVGNAVIASGPLHASGMVQGFRLMTGADGTTIRHLRFTVDLAIITAASHRVDDVAVSQNTIENAVQGVSAWLGSGWQITQNDIVDLRSRCGGGIGILIGEYNAGTVSGNVIAHNRITGTLHVSPTDCGGYSGTGIVVYADYRFGRLGAAHITNNYIIQNTVTLVSDTPSVVDVIAVELTEAADPDPSQHVIHDNAIGFNDLRGTATQLAFTPAALDGPVNSISRNLGENRGRGLHPAAFEP